MEHLGLLEDSQGCFRPGMQTQTSIVKLVYAIEEARRTKGHIVVAFLDWFWAFDSVDLGRLYLLFEQMGMHSADVDLLRQCHSGAWVTVRTPFGETARVQVMLGSPQGDSLSPSLFVFFLNLCLRHLGTSGVGFVHGCGVRLNATCFADDLALLATS
eukprot:2085573-Rhodomonas_salina.1